MDLCRQARAASGGWFDPWRLPGGVDPTGLVKGWAAELALAELRGSAAAAMVNAGGDIAVFGEPEPGQQWRIGIRDPLSADRLLAVVALGGHDRAVATSGAYERGAHVLDPGSGEAGPGTAGGDRRRPRPGLRRRPGDRSAGLRRPGPGARRGAARLQRAHRRQRRFAAHHARIPGGRPRPRPDEQAPAAGRAAAGGAARPVAQAPPGLAPPDRVESPRCGPRRGCHGRPVNESRWPAGARREDPASTLGGALRAAEGETRSAAALHRRQAGRRRRGRRHDDLSSTTLRFCLAAGVACALAWLTYARDGWIPILSEPTRVARVGHLVFFLVAPALGAVRRLVHACALPLAACLSFWRRGDERLCSSPSPGRPSRRRRLGLRPRRHAHGHAAVQRRRLGSATTDNILGELGPPAAPTDHGRGTRRVGGAVSARAGARRAKRRARAQC